MSGELGLRPMVGIKSTFTIDTIKGAHLSVGRQQVDAELHAKAATMDRPEDGRGVYNSTHIYLFFECKGNEKLGIRN